MTLRDARQSALQAGIEADEALAKERAEAPMGPQHNHRGNCRKYHDPWGHDEWCRDHGMMRGSCSFCLKCPACEVK